MLAFAEELEQEAGGLSRRLAAIREPTPTPPFLRDVWRRWRIGSLDLLERALNDYGWRNSAVPVTARELAADMIANAGGEAVELTKTDVCSVGNGLGKLAIAGIAKRLRGPGGRNPPGARRVAEPPQGFVEDDPAGAEHLDQDPRTPRGAGRGGRRQGGAGQPEGCDGARSSASSAATLAGVVAGVRAATPTSLG